MLVVAGLLGYGRLVVFVEVLVTGEGGTGVGGRWFVG